MTHKSVVDSSRRRFLQATLALSAGAGVVGCASTGVRAGGRVVVIGGGAAGLIAADLLAGTCEVHLCEQGRTLGRKFLVAGDGGLNITHSAVEEDLWARYTPTEFMGCHATQVKN